MPATPGLRGCNTITAQVAVTGSTALVSTGLTMPNYRGSMFRFFIQLLWQQLGVVGGIRYRFANVGITMNAISLRYDIDNGTMSQVIPAGGTSIMTWVPSGTTQQYLTFEGLGRFNASPSNFPDFQFAQAVADANSTLVLPGSYMEWVVF